MSSLNLQEFLFDPFEDLMKLKDIPKVTRCLALMAKMVTFTLAAFNLLFKWTFQAGVKDFEDITIELPDEDNNEENSIEEDFWFIENRND